MLNMWPFDIFTGNVKSSFKAVKKDNNSIKAWLSLFFTSQKAMETKLERLEKRVWELEAERIRII